MIGIVATLKVQEGKAAEFEATFKQLTAKVRADEPGNIAYQLTKSRADPLTYKVLELYEDEAAMAAHMQTPYFRELFAQIAPCLDGAPEAEFLDGVQ